MTRALRDVLASLERGDFYADTDRASADLGVVRRACSALAREPESFPDMERQMDDAVLAELVDAVPDFGWSVPIRLLVEATGLTRESVRASLHRMRAEGDVAFARGRMTEHGETAGAGYHATDAGVSRHARAQTEEKQA